MQSAYKATESNIVSEYLTFSQLSAWLGISEKFLRKHNAEGRIPGSIRMGARWMFRKAIIEKQLITGGQLLLEKRKPFIAINGIYGANDSKL